ncbi:hypothetical protein M407DRAFT_246848 [Tulasnella calospora MUT 4182]|uniref:Methyltransferase domain-containing protein n=2 Tax=Tulasnella calospora MUT 4182 TaxID=1051891 RepID=A0A0C3Q2N1_9AGAM|nr:hypothetical protein M407DRAFT_246848 [Tulasnella calospora MUT 4182]
MNPERQNSPTPSVMSFRSSMHSERLFREVAGRTLNTRNDLYMLPVDDEEQDRQDIEHRALYLVLDGLYAAPDLVAKAMAPRQNRPPAVFDIGTGSGIWAMDMAREFPHAEVVGIDLAPPTLHSEGIPNNCRFEVDDANLDLSHYADCFNVVHMRSVAQGIRNYKDTIHRVAQTMRSGGVLLLSSGAYSFFDENRQPLPVVGEGQPGWTACQALLTKVYELGRNGADLDAPSQWDKWLEASPFYTNVGAEDIYVPIGPWSPNLDMRCQRIAQLTQIDAGKVFPAFRPILTLGGMEPATADRWIATAVREVQEMRPKVFLRWRYVWAVRTKTKWYETT